MGPRMAALNDALTPSPGIAISGLKTANSCAARGEWIKIADRSLLHRHVPGKIET